MKSNLSSTLTHTVLLSLILLMSLAIGCGDKPASTSPTPSALEVSSKPTGSFPEAEIPGVWMAAATGDKATVEDALKRGLDVNLREPMGGSTLLITSAFAGQTEVVQTLMKNGADLEAKNNEGASALYTAAFFSHPETLQVLIDGGGDVNTFEKNGQTPLDSVSGPWTPELEGIYKIIEGILQMDLDIPRIQKTRPQIAAMLQKHGAKLSSEL